MNDEWIWAAAIFAAPLLVFAAFELASYIRRRNAQAIARRSKSAPGAPGRSLRGG